jgi:PAS domain S-box-containing protein
MKLSTRLSIAMVGLVLLTATIVGIVGHGDLPMAIVATLAAAAAATLLAHVLSRKFVQMSDAIEAFGRGRELSAPTGASGEVGMLSRTFASMASEIRSGNAKLRDYRRRERFYVAAVESSSYAFITVDPAGTITAWNPGAEKLFGHSADDAIGQSLSLIIPERKRSESRLNREKIHRHERVSSLETVRLAKDGPEINVVIDGSPIISKSGNLLGSAIIVRDLTDEKLSQEMFRLAVETCPNGMVMFDRSNRIVMVNAEMERLFGYERQELFNQTIDVLVPRGLDAGDSEHRDICHRTSANDLVGVRKDGERFPVEIFRNPIHIRAGMLVLGVIVDISERRQNERLKDEFISTVSHELRTPLTSIAGSLGLLAGGASGQMSEPTMRLLRIAHKNSERLVRLINDILDIEKIESGKVVFDLKRVELGALIEQSIEANRGYAEGYHVSVRFDAERTPAYVRADPDRLVQVITNLLSNAVKFSPQGEEVIVAVEPQAQTWRLTVRDRGIGIPEDFKPRIFEKFAQADATDARQKGGTGLGLSIVKQIVTLLGGAVGFDTPAGGGTVFHVDLPRWELAAGAEATAADVSPHVLICDDDASVARTIASRLERNGFPVDVALTAQDAMAKARANGYAAILVDLKLPDRDGISLIQELRSAPQYHNTPIVVVSADAARGREDFRSSTLNVLDWLNKPIDTAALVAVLNRPLARNGSKRPRILHIDDDADVRAVVAGAVGQSCEVTSVASIADAHVALTAQQFELAVLDLVLSQGSGLDLLPDLRDREGNAMPVILYSARAANGRNAAQVQAALTKSHTSIDHLILTLRRHMAGRHAPVQQTRDVA